jgi:hypothetical protein
MGRSARVVSVTDAAIHLKTTVATVNNLIRKGGITTQNIAGVTYVVVDFVTRAGKKPLFEPNRPKHTP